MKKIIIDTDIGGDIDDIWSLLLMLSNKDFNISLISITQGDIEYKAKLVAKILFILGMEHIPIAMGYSTNRDEVIYPQNRWINDFELNKYKGKIYQDYKKAYKEIIGNSYKEHTVIALGPFTSLAKVLNILTNNEVNIIAMAGSIYKGYFDHNYCEPECNIVSDINSANEVLQSGIDITLLPLDVCRDIILKDNNYNLIKNSDNIFAKIVMENYYIWQEDYVGGAVKYDINTSSSILYDFAPVWYLLFPQNFEVVEVSLSVDSSGKTIINGNNKISVALDLKNIESMEEYTSNQLCFGSGRIK